MSNDGEEQEQMTWPQACGHYGGNERIMGHLCHKCNHPYNKQSCLQVSCPLRKLEIFEALLESLEEKLEDSIGTDEELWYNDEIRWLNKEINKIMNELEAVD